MFEDEVIDTGAEEVVEVTEPVETENESTEKPATMEDTLRAKYRELTADPEVAKEVVAKPAAKAPEPKTGKAAEPKADTVVDEAGRVRGPDGKFVAKTDVTQEAQKAAEQAPVVAQETPKPPADPTHAKAPTSWKGTAQAKWDAVDPEVKAEVHRRESDFHNGLKQYKQDADTFKLLDAEIRPYEAMIRASGSTPQALIRDFFNTAYQFKTGSPEAKVETLLSVAKAWNVDLGLLPAVQERVDAGQPIVPPEYRQLQQQFTALQETIAQREAREKQEREEAAQREQEEVTTQTRQWAVDKEHYESVKLVMAGLLESGQAKDLDDAYNKATWAVPEVRTKLIAQQQEAERKLAAEKAAAAKKAASTNVKPRGTPPAKPNTKVGTMEDTLRAAYRKLNGQNA